MGTVGLSFGSPTSGTGFDVSSTVAEIVANLQNVETPWKTQLSALQSQDTVISNLGTLFSNLSNDLGQLTDFQGILAQKEGSSSNTNVLELTAASSSATAGTHTVLVNSLAQTSSGYLTEIANASDTLSGSITLQAGGATAQTITLNSSNDTLSGLAAAINASGAGVTASVLTDASGSRLSLVSGTSGAGGDISVSANSIIDSSNWNAPLAYNVAVPGANANLTVDGVNLTSASNTVSNLIPGVTFQLLSASTSPVQVVIGNDNTDIESTVNQFVTDYNSLIKALNAQEGNTSSGAAEPLFGSPTLSLLQQQLLGGLNAQNPNGYLDAIPSAAGTTLSGSITIQTGSGTPENIVIGAAPVPPAANTIYTGSGANGLSDLAAAINSAGLGVAAGIATSNGESTLTLTSQTVGTAGALTVTSGLESTAAGISTAINYNPSSDVNNLTSLGISVNNDGSLTFDSSSLDSLLDSDYSGIAGFFQNAAGWGQNFATILNNAGNSSPTGILALAASSNSGTESTLNAEISKEQTYISTQQASLTTELNQANQILQQLPSQLDGINEIYSAITGYNQNANG